MAPLFGGETTFCPNGTRINLTLTCDTSLMPWTWTSSFKFKDCDFLFSKHWTLRWLDRRKRQGHCCQTQENSTDLLNSVALTCTMWQWPSFDDPWTKLHRMAEALILTDLWKSPIKDISGTLQGPRTNWRGSTGTLKPRMSQRAAEDRQALTSGLSTCQMSPNLHNLIYSAS